MDYRVISLKYRPQNFDELTGQSHVVLSLKGAINQNKVGHAFLFAGPRGIGKTTTARIFAKSLNCTSKGPTIHPCQECQSCREITASRSIDVIEIDGASNRGIEEVRNLREGVKYSPLYSRYKIYIIDEVHMLTQEAFNALLKTLEEPPQNVKFIFATTNPIKVPGTILSRCQRFMFKRLSQKEIISRLKMICNRENIKITEKALHYLAIKADGSIRDGESILEQLTSFVEGEITEKDIFQLLGFIGNDFYLKLLRAIKTADLHQTILILNSGIENGVEPIEVYQGLIGSLRSLLLVKVGVSKEILELNDEDVKALEDLKFSQNEIIKMINIGLNFEEMIKRAVNVRLAIELLLSQLTISHSPSQSSSNIIGLSSNISNPKDIKEKLLSDLQQGSPKLASFIKRIEFKEEGQLIVVANNQFTQNELEKNKVRLNKIFSKTLARDCTIEIVLENLKSKEEKGLVHTIKTLFDGEEVR